MMKILFILVILVGLSFGNEVDLLNAESSLLSTLFTSQIKTIRPSFQLNISVDLTLKQIISVDEKTQIITTSSYLFISWYDKRLTWTPANMSGLIRMPALAKLIWLPDIFIENAVDTNAFLPVYDSSVLWIYNDGKIYLTVSLNGLKTRCQMEPTKFPYDSLNCSIKIGSWQYDDERIELVSATIDDSKPDYIPHPNWDLIKMEDTSSYTGLRTHYDPRASDTYNRDVWFDILIKRKSAYYMINNIYPSLILNVVILFAFALPFASQISLGNLASLD